MSSAVHTCNPGICKCSGTGSVSYTFNMMLKCVSISLHAVSGFMTCCALSPSHNVYATMSSTGQKGFAVLVNQFQMTDTSGVQTAE